MAHLLRLQALAALAVCGAGLGCQTSAAAPPYTPYQGIRIDSASLVAPYGCGMGATQVYRYVVAVSYAPGPAEVLGFGVAGYVPGLAEGVDAAPGFHQLGPFIFGIPEPALTTGVFDCFADGVFEGLPPPPASFVATIYAFSYPESIDAGLACDASPCVPPPLEAGAPISGFSWTTTCTATEEAAESVVAQCAPLQAPPDAGTAPDAANSDAEVTDAGAMDAEILDAGTTDANASDGSSPEGGD